MNEMEQERYEAELRHMPPARLPEHFMARLQAAKPGTKAARGRPLHPAARIPEWRSVLRWLAPAMVVALAGLLAGRANFAPWSSLKKQTLAAASGLKADNVQVDEELVLSFEVVAKLPGGQPVRFRCQQWKDQLIVTDNNRGVEIERNSPRVEVVPVRFETY